MDELVVYGSEACLGWEDVEQLLDQLENTSDLSIKITVKDPIDHREEFREKGLTICPSFLLNDELIAVGTPDYDFLTSTLKSDG